MKSPANDPVNDPAVEHFPPEHPYHALSALIDGQGTALDESCRLWREDPQARQTWHMYHLIGDVMRSDELARPVAADQVLLHRVRLALDKEAVVSAPAALLSAAVPSPTPQHPSLLRRPPRWAWPAVAVLALAWVAGTLVLAPSSSPSDSASTPSLALNAGPPIQSVVQTVGVGALVRPAGMLRDLHLDELLRAHQSARGGVAVAPPGGGLWQVDHQAGSAGGQ